ncbi:MAG: N-acetyltransferase family protein [Cytophagales bacterium]|nr:MAG: N-acetyltransferase family protein [Cytophagales bacterium]TAF61971.1 MAG: N-acetyltransferase family protein [Cytophagales bacterium]
MQIFSMLPEHYEAVRAIYEEGILTKNATFETLAPDWESWHYKHLEHSRLVALEDEQVIGWAALTPLAERCASVGVAEVSVYFRMAFTGRGFGRLLLNALIAESEKNGIWTLQSGIFPENTASIQLHLRCGFRQVGYRERVGLHEGVWRNTVLMERRSQVVGI